MLYDKCQHHAVLRVYSIALNERRSSIFVSRPFVHIVSVPPPSCVGQWDSLLGLLPETERVRVLSFLRENDRNLALGSRLLQRALVSQASVFLNRRPLAIDRRNGSEPLSQARILLLSGTRHILRSRGKHPSDAFYDRGGTFP